MGYRVKVVSGSRPSNAFMDKVYDTFVGTKKALGDRKTKLVIFSGASFQEHGSNAWTAGGRVHLMMNSTHMGGHDSMNLTESTPMEYYAFLCIHEIGHSVFPPESIIPYATGSQLVEDVLGKPFDKHGPNAVADIIANTSIMMEPNVEKFTGFKGTELVRAKFVQENGPDFDMDTAKYTQGSFFDYHLYYYRKITGNPMSKKPGNSTTSEMLEKIIMKKKPCFQWLDEFYLYWTKLLVAYREKW